MRIGLAYDLKSAVPIRPDAAEDESEEYDPPSTIDALAAEVEGLGHQVVRLGGGAEFLDRIRNSNLDLVFNVAEGRGVFRSREAQVPCVLEMLGIPYTGSDPLTLALTLDKPLAKSIALSASVRTPNFRVVDTIQELRGSANGSLKFPVVVKPSFEGSSKGIRLTSRVDRNEDMERQVSRVLDGYHQPALLEEFVAGREITVGIVGNSPPQVVGAMEVVPRNGHDGNFMYTLEVKRDWERLVSYRCPPELPDSCIEETRDAALTLFKAFQCRDIARIDFRVDEGNRPHFLEANPLPGLSPACSDLPIMAGLSGWSYTRLIATVLESALDRYRLR